MSLSREESASRARCSSYRNLPGRSQTIELVVRINRAYPNRVPSLDQLQRNFGMSRATAYRWRRAWIDAGVRDSHEETP